MIGIKIFSQTLFFLLFTQSVFSHGGLDHSKESKKREEAPSNQKKAAIKRIAIEYESKVAPIFEKSCMQCHGGRDDLPSYYPFPLVKQLIDHDREEAKKHLDMSNGYPFEGHGDLEADLEAIKQSVANKSMPLWRYLIMNSDAKLTKGDIRVLNKWVSDSLKSLKTAGLP